MRFAILGSGAVGGYYGAKLALAGHDVTFIARGAHLDAIRAHGLQVRSPALGDFTARAAAEQDTAESARSISSFSPSRRTTTSTALPPLLPLLGPESAVLTLQNGVDSVSELAARRR